MLLRGIRMAKIGDFCCQILVACVYILYGRSEVCFWLCRIYTLCIFITWNIPNLRITQTHINVFESWVIPIINMLVKNLSLNLIFWGSWILPIYLVTVLTSLCVSVFVCCVCVCLGANNRLSFFHWTDCIYIFLWWHPDTIFRSITVANWLLCQFPK